MAVKKHSAKNSAKFPQKASARKKVGKRRAWSRVKTVAIGVDISLYSISVAGGAALPDGKFRVGTYKLAWEKDDDYLLRMKQAAKAHDVFHNLFENMKIECDLHQVFVAVEEAVSFGHIQRHAGQTIKQQIQMSGAFIGGVLRYGWPHLYEIQANQWRKMVADDLGITIHHTKWNPDKHIGKYRAQQWVEKFHPKWDGHWPDMIRTTKRGLIPRPESSKAKGEQSDDRYEALAIMEFMRRTLKEVPF